MRAVKRAGIESAIAWTMLRSRFFSLEEEGLLESFDGSDASALHPLLEDAETILDYVDIRRLGRLLVLCEVLDAVVLKELLGETCIMDTCMVLHQDPIAIWEELLGMRKKGFLEDGLIVSCAEAALIEVEGQLALAADASPHTDLRPKLLDSIVRNLR